MDRNDAAIPQTSFAYNFNAEYERAVDAKGRFNLPFRFRRAMPAGEEERYMVTRGPDGALVLMPFAEWQANFNRLRQGPPTRERREYLRRMSRASREVTPDSQGRIAIPARFLDVGGIGRKVVVVGMGGYMELWAPESLPSLDDDFSKADENMTNEFFR